MSEPLGEFHAISAIFFKYPLISHAKNISFDLNKNIRTNPNQSNCTAPTQASCALCSTECAPAPAPAPAVWCFAQRAQIGAHPSIHSQVHACSRPQLLFVFHTFGHFMFCLCANRLSMSVSLRAQLPIRPMWLAVCLCVINALAHSAQDCAANIWSPNCTDMHRIEWIESESAATIWRRTIGN